MALMRMVGYVSNVLAIDVCGRKYYDLLISPNLPIFTLRVPHATYWDISTIGFSILDPLFATNGISPDSAFSASLALHIRPIAT